MDKEKIKKIGILRALQLGDLLCSIPAIRALKKEYPSADIYLIGLSSAKELVHRFKHYFSGLIPFPGFPGLPEQAYNVQDIANFIRDMQAEEFDLVLQMQGNGTLVNPLVELFGASYLGGFFTSANYKPPSELFLKYPDNQHEIERHLLLMKHIGVWDADDTDLEFPLYDSDFENFEELNLGLVINDYVCIHPGSRGSWRQWPTKYFAELGDRCMMENKQVVITGTREELPIVYEVVRQMKSPPLIAAGKTKLGSMGVLIKNAYAIISNCTGVSHIASALGTPGIIISMDGEPQRWRPLKKELFYTLDWMNNPDFSMAEKALEELLKIALFYSHKD